ncbi:hypothetical protein VTK56DRAFT_3269 [Thermocarpiscus australiensis]
MPNRKPIHTGVPDAEPTRRRSLRLQKAANSATRTVAGRAAARATNGDKPEPSNHDLALLTDGETEKATTESRVRPGPPAEKGRSGKRSGQRTANETGRQSKKAKTAGDAVTETLNEATSGDGERNYWLMKAEPESRLENGVDVKFSIDDLAAKTEPEPWDGIRAYAARNNLRAMKKGDMAFFYHSNCKEPGIVGTMEIVQEHSPDLSAHDPKAPYYDPSSKPSDPKWSVVHVEFRSKFAVPIGLKELREMGAPGKPLENMQMLKQSRLSVSRVSAAEWEYLMRVAEEKASGK